MMNKMKINELQIGDWVYESEHTKFPMFVAGTFKDIVNNGVVYLDFNGNEGELWEVDIDDISPIPITEEFLLKNGFKRSENHVWRDYNVDATWDYETNDMQSFTLEKYPNDENLVCGYGSCLWNGVNIKYVHELQNAMRLAGIEWEVKI